MSAYQMLDVEAAVRAAARQGALLWMLPWINCYTWFLQPGVPLPGFLSPALLAQLQQLRCPRSSLPPQTGSHRVTHWLSSQKKKRVQRGCRRGARSCGTLM